MPSYQLDWLLLLLSPIVKHVTLADDFKVGENSSFGQSRYSYDSNLVDLLHNSFYLWNESLLDDAFVLLDEVLEVIDITYLGRYRDPLLV